MQVSQLLTADAERNGTATTNLWFYVRLNDPLPQTAADANSSPTLADPSSTGSVFADSSSSSSDASSATTSGGYASALASFTLQSGKMEFEELTRVAGELVFQGALMYDAASDIIAVLATRIEGPATQPVVKDNTFSVYEPMSLSLVRSWRSVDLVAAC